MNYFRKGVVYRHVNGNYINRERPIFALVLDDTPNHEGWYWVLSEKGRIMQWCLDYKKRTPLGDET